MILGQHAVIIGWGLPPAPDFAQVVFFFFALIGDWRLEHQQEKYRKKCIHRPPAPEIEEPANPNGRQRKEGSYRQKNFSKPTLNNRFL